MQPSSAPARRQPLGGVARRVARLPQRQQRGTGGRAAASAARHSRRSAWNDSSSRMPPGPALVRGPRETGRHHAHSPGAGGRSRAATSRGSARSPPPARRPGGGRSRASGRRGRGPRRRAGSAPRRSRPPRRTRRAASPGCSRPGSARPPGRRCSARRRGPGCAGWPPRSGRPSGRCTSCRPRQRPGRRAARSRAPAASRRRAAQSSSVKARTSPSAAAGAGVARAAGTAVRLAQQAHARAGRRPCHERREVRRAAVVDHDDLEATGAGSRGAPARCRQRRSGSGPVAGGDDDGDRGLVQASPSCSCRAVGLRDVADTLELHHRVPSCSAPAPRRAHSPPLAGAVGEQAQREHERGAPERRPRRPRGRHEAAQPRRAHRRDERRAQRERARAARGPTPRAARRRRRGRRRSRCAARRAGARS